MTTTNNSIKKPISLRVIFILNLVKIFLAFGIYTIITVKGIVPGINPDWILYTACGYIVTFSIMVFSILKKNIILFRLIIITDIIISIPAKAIIGILIGGDSVLISFNKKIKNYFYE